MWAIVIQSAAWHAWPIVPWRALASLSLAFAAMLATVRMAREIE